MAKSLGSDDQTWSTRRQRSRRSVAVSTAAVMMAAGVAAAFAPAAAQTMTDVEVPSSSSMAAFAPVGSAGTTAGTKKVEVDGGRFDHHGSDQASHHIAAKKVDVDGGRFDPNDTSAPDGVDKSLWHKPENNLTSPIPWGTASPDEDPGVPLGRQYACYPASAGAAGGYLANCANPGYTVNSLGYAFHWGPSGCTIGTTYVSKCVYVLNSLSQQRARLWLEYEINSLNNSWTGNTANRPYFVHFYADNPAFNLPMGPCYTSSSTHPQWIEMCDTTGGSFAQAYGYTPESTNQHFRWAQGQIQNTLTNDYWVNYVVLHELGHAIGFSHDTDCPSVMTYCGTYVGNAYLFYSTNQSTVYVKQYDTHVG